MDNLYDQTLEFVTKTEQALDKLKRKGENIETQRVLLERAKETNEQEIARKEETVALMRKVVIEDYGLTPEKAKEMEALRRKMEIKIKNGEDKEDFLDEWEQMPRQPVRRPLPDDEGRLPLDRLLRPRALRARGLPRRR